MYILGIILVLAVGGVLVILPIKCYLMELKRDRKEWKKYYNEFDWERVPMGVMAEVVINKEGHWYDKENNKHYIIKIPLNKDITDIVDDDVTIEEVVELPIGIPKKLYK